MRHRDRRFISDRPDDPLPANLAALWMADAALAARVEACAPEVVDPLDTPAAELPATDVLREHFAYAVADAGRSLASLYDATGGADGQALLAVVRDNEGELLRDLATVDVSTALASGRVALLIGEPSADGYAAVLAGRNLLISLGFQPVGPVPADAIAALEHLQSLETMNIATALQHGRKSTINLIENLTTYAATPGIAGLKNAAMGRTAVVVSAGPSLRKNLHLLRGREGEAVVIAVQTALKPCLEAGVVPHLVCAIDHHEISTRFYADLPDGLPTQLVADPKCSGAVVRAWLDRPGRRIRMLGNDQANSFLREVQADCPTLPPTATVAQLAFELAEWLGCSTCLLIGQDLGFSDGLAYAPGTGYDDAWRPETGRFCTFEMKQWEHIARDRAALVRANDWRGNPTYTEKRLASYLNRFEQMFARTPMRVIDATEGGLLKRGAEPMALATALAAVEPGPAIALPTDDNVRPTTSIEACLSARRREAGEVEAASRASVALLDRIREHPGDAGIVNAAVAALDVQRRRLREDRDVDRTYGLVAGLTQRSERDRLLADLRIAAGGLDDVERRRRQAERDLANVQAIGAAAADLRETLSRHTGTELARAA